MVEKETASLSDSGTTLGNARVPIVGFAGYSGSGKTTLLTRLIVLLREHEIRIGVVKHAHHRFDIDQRGKDSHRLRAAGAGQVLLGSRHRLALMMEHESEREEPDLNELLGMLDQSRLDLIVVEGFKHEQFPKIEVHRPATGKPLLFPDDPAIVAIATDAAPGTLAQHPAGLTVLNLNQVEQVLQFVQQRILGPADASPPASSAR